ncbi:MAG: tryptophan--tRNA ligase [Elusimicrobia bacterium RIFCSPLOWO2_01_FULL_64_13]|nr:MAG: tryptophan--tRNA ligase [Elusimicrobia bacterium RIFCSPHIGHO2_01_FULL_64_10]OGR94063.1 MAG: tryptophan--tRNA ligase [Elusimicrobia bacterium RIFCSPLOWO2_01_FULL_64_13]
MDKKRVLSGMRPTGKLHLGNHFGALSNWLKLQSSDPGCFYMVADWHALTTDYADTSNVESNAGEMVLDWLAQGLDPKKSVLFRQSWVAEHAELALILSMITPLSWLERNPTYKEQMNELKDRDISTHGFLGYPVLQAADILLYHASHVPVGEDQLPHLELTREIARRFNHIYKKQVLKEPQAILSNTPKVPGTDGRKMSKSYDNCVYLADEEPVLKKKINSMYTDPQKIRADDPGHPLPCPENPPGCVVFALHKIYGRPETLGPREADCRSGALGCVACKKDLFESMNNALGPAREKRRSLEKEKDLVRSILSDGSKKARETASRTVEEIRRAVRFESEGGR